MAISFKEIKRGFPVFILHKNGEDVKATEGKVVNVSDPHLPQNFNPSNPTAYNQMQQLMIDVTIEEDGATNTYCIPENLTVTYAGDIILATEREGIIREVQALVTQDDEHIKAVPMHEKRRAACSAILEQWDTAYKERKENDQRFKDIETHISGLDTRMGGLENKIDLLLKKLE